MEFSSCMVLETRLRHCNFSRARFTQRVTTCVHHSCPDTGGVFAPSWQAGVKNGWHARERNYHACSRHTRAWPLLDYRWAEHSRRY